MERKPLSKRTRFEVFKRDGFRCRYCGVNSSQALLHVDHVIAVAEGGTDDPANLVTACGDCNLGKSSIALDESQLTPPDPTEAMLEHAEQMRAYLDASKQLHATRAAMVQEVVNVWCDLVDPEGMQRQVANSIPYWIGEIGLDGVLRAVEATSANSSLRYETAQRKYFLAVMRNMRDGTEPRRFQR